jgi:hypothetical protein
MALDRCDAGKRRRLNHLGSFWLVLEQAEGGQVDRAGPVAPVRRLPGDGGAHRRGAAAERGGLVAVHRDGRGDLEYLVAVVGAAVRKAHQHRCPGRLRDCDRSWQQPDVAAEERNLDGSAQVAVQRRSVNRDRQHLARAHGAGRPRRGVEPAGPWLDIGVLAVPAKRLGVDPVPEPPLGGREAHGVVVLPAPDGGNREPAGAEHRERAVEGPEVGRADDHAPALFQRRVQVFLAADLDQAPQRAPVAAQAVDVDRLARGVPEPLPGELAFRGRGQFLAKHPPQIAGQLGPLGWLPAPEPVTAAAGDAVTGGGRQPRQHRRGCGPVGDSLGGVQQVP